MAQMKKRLNLESVDTIFYVTFLQDGPPRAPKAAHGTQRCAELQMEKVVSGDLLKHGPFPGHELDYGELRKNTKKKIIFPPPKKT